MEVELFEIRIPLVHPFVTSFGEQREKAAILIKVTDADGNVGWGETSLEAHPGYCYETTTTAWYIQETYLIPQLQKLFQEKVPTIVELLTGFSGIRGHEFAKGGLESAYWALRAEQEKKSLGDFYGATKEKIPTGVSIGIQPNQQALLERIAAFINKGYHRIKIKIKPGWDSDIVAAVRQEFGDIQLMVDANSAYTLSDAHIQQLKKLDRFELMMIEQPLHYQDLLQHKKLQAQLQTPVCLDESIHTVSDAILAIEEECCQIINIKPGRVGGYYNAKIIAEKLGQNRVWCGGMLETGIGRVHNLFIQAKAEYNIPGDTSGSDRYFARDIITPQVEVDAQGYVRIPKGIGLGVEVDEERIRQLSIRNQSF